MNKNDQIAQIFNDYPGQIVTTVDLFPWPSPNGLRKANKILQFIQKFEIHPTINKIKQGLSVKTKFLFKPIAKNELKRLLKISLTKNSTG